MSLYLTPRQVAERWACSARHVRRLCLSGDLPAMRLGTDWRISLAAAEAYERDHTSEPATSSSSTSDEGRIVEAPKEVTHTTSADGFSLPADYEPVFRDLWPGHEVTAKRKRLPAVTRRR